MASLFRPGKQQEPERREERELSIEEQLLAEKARVAAARREAERRAQIGDVSDFLDDILVPEGQAAPSGPSVSASPAVDRVFANEPGEPEQPEPTAPFGTEEPPDAEVPGAGQTAPAPFGGEDRSQPSAPPAEAGRRTLSVSMADAWTRIVSLGRSGEEGMRPVFEPEPVSGIFDRTVEMLAVRRRRHRLKLEFEPEPAREDRSPQSTHQTVILPPSRQGSVPPAYSLDDLPAPSPGVVPGGNEPADRPMDVEPPLQEDDLDDHALNEALAAAEVASRKAALAPSDQAVPAPAAPKAAGPEPAARPQPVPGRKYSLEDLPQAPLGSGRPEGSDRFDRSDNADRTDGDQLRDEQLPDLPSGAAAAVTPSRPGEFMTLERAVDRSVEPGKSGSSPAAAPGGLAPPVAAENAADLSIQQLADMERYIESRVETEVGPRPAAGKTVVLGRLTLAGLLTGAGKAVFRLALHLLRAFDRMLDPYCLSCKRLLGIVGVLMWAALIAYVIKTWILPGMHGGE